MRSQLLAVCAALWPLAAVAASPEDAARKARPIACGDIRGSDAGIAGTLIDSAADAPADKGLPAACVVRGTVDPRVGADGKAYALKFELRLPAGWNGRFLHQVNGGNDGAVLPAIGDPQELNAYGGVPALARGFAVLSSDEGHDGADPANASMGLQAGAAFGVDPQARDAYGYAGDMRLGPIGKALVARILRSGAGDLLHDGLLERRPARDGRSHPHGRRLRRLRRRRSRVQPAARRHPARLGRPELRDDRQGREKVLLDRRHGADCSQGARSLRPARRRRGRDRRRHPGLSEGVPARGPDLPGREDRVLLSKTQVEALARAFGGPRNSKGEQLYSDWPYDGGMGSANWRFWKISSSIPPWHDNPLIATMGAGSLAAIFTTPPTLTEGSPEALMAYLEGFDFDRDAPKIYASGAFPVAGRTIDYPESAWAFMTPPDADDPKLEKLRAAGHKLIVYHGQSDGVFSFNASANWVERLKANAPDADGFARLYAVPGMNHCGKGPATDRFDALAAIVDWAEAGKAPDRIIATVTPGSAEVPADWSPTRTRPLCPWPKVARYAGGDKEKAESFECR